MQKSRDRIARVQGLGSGVPCYASPPPVARSRGADISRSALTVQREIKCCIAKRCCNAVGAKCCSAIHGSVTELPRFEWLARRPVVRNQHTSSKSVQMQHSKPKRSNFHLSLGPYVNGKIALPGYLGTVSSTSRLGSSNAGGLHVRNLA